MRHLLPLFGFMWLMALLGYGVFWNNHHDQRSIASPLINQPAPDFALPDLYHPEHIIYKSSLLGKAYILHVFASWCVVCRAEHALLMQQVKQLGMPLIGYNYKDQPASAIAWLRRHGNPYHQVITDRSGMTALDFGIYGAPETYLIDAYGLIRYKRVGALTPTVIHEKIAPAIALLNRHAAP